MKKKTIAIIAIVFIIAGTVCGYFAKNDMTALGAFAVTMFGAGVACAAMWEGRKPDASKKVVIATIVMVGLGSFLAGFTGIVSESEVTTVIGLVTSLILIISGIITYAFKASE